MKTDRISIAMCTYNGSGYLGEQLDSIAAQTMLPFELIVCDDGSSDSTLEIVTDFARTVSFPVKIYRNEDRLGSTKNFEKAISLCAGELIALCDQDDRWVPEKLERLSLEFQQDASVGAVFSDGQLIDEDGRTNKNRLWHVFRFWEKNQREFRAEGPFRLLCHGDFITGATMMLRTSLRPVLLPIPRSWIHDAWLAWMVALRCRVSFVADCLIEYRVHRSQQIGTPTKSVRDRIRNCRTSQSAVCSARAARFAELARYLANEFPDAPASAKKEVRDLISICQVRSALGNNPLKRLWLIGANLPGYFRYAGGLRSALRDLLQERTNS
ncbi:MAG: glycosyltransferase family 2 protein [Acidobacteria bacterium]|nr:glycosyltransferase family 2 protein [Acidobacteriota bacterium]